jgi:hypothetical protein
MSHVMKISAMKCWLKERDLKLTAMVGKSERLTGIFVLFFTVSMLACSPETIIRDRPHGLNEYPETNLPAIKALLAQERQQFSPVRTPMSTGRSQSPLSSSAGDDMAASSESALSRHKDQPRLVPKLLSTPSLSTTASQGAERIQIPRPTTRSSADYSRQGPSSVAPYTFYAPTGSAYPGSIRCVPDYLGGQRCHNSP